MSQQPDLRLEQIRVRLQKTIAKLEPFISHPHFDETLARSIQNIAKAALSAPPVDQQS